jgi:hypothetical protein
MSLIEDMYYLLSMSYEARFRKLWISSERSNVVLYRLRDKIKRLQERLQYFKDFNNDLAF